MIEVSHKKVDGIKTQQQVAIYILEQEEETIVHTSQVLSVQMLMISLR